MATEHLMDSVNVTSSGGTAVETISIQSDQQVAFYLDADGNGANLDVSFRVTPDGDLTGLQFTDAAEDLSSQDAQDGLVIKPNLQPADEVEVTITNQGASDTVVDLFAKPYNA